MKTMIETPAGLREIERGELGRVLYECRHGAVRAWLVPETAVEVLDQRAKAAKAAEERRSHAKHIHRPSKEKKEAFFRGVHKQDTPMAEETVSWKYTDILAEAGISPSNRASRKGEVMKGIVGRSEYLRVLIKRHSPYESLGRVIELELGLRDWEEIMTPKELMDIEEERYAAECSAIHDQLEGMKGIGR